MTTTVFVPLRGGSRAIPGKNLRPFCGRPLMWWCLRAAQEAERVDRIVVATDSDEIEERALGFGFSKLEVYRRTAESAIDTAGTEAVMLEYLAASTDDEDEDLFVLAQATSPFTRARDFDAALHQLAESGADSMLSCVEVRRFFWDRCGLPINYEPAARPRRQDFEGCLMENGAFYASTVARVRQFRNRMSGVVSPFVMPSYTGLELDEPEDWVAGEALMRRHLSAELGSRPIRLVLTDLDGVLTDGGMYYADDGRELKKFNTVDGKAFELLRNRGIRTGIVTASASPLIGARARKIGADYLFEGAIDKLPIVRDLCAREGFELDEVAYMGDDVGDLEVLRAVGFAACPSTALDDVVDAVHYVAERGGGEGCLREIVDRFVLRQGGGHGARRDSAARA